MKSKDKVTYISDEAKNFKVESLQLEDIPGRARNSFRKSLENAIETQALIREDLDDGFIIDDEFIAAVVNHLRNKANFGPVWAEYVFEVKDEQFKDMIKLLLEGLKKRKVPVSFANLYKHMARELGEKDWMPIPEDYLTFTKKYNLLFAEHSKKEMRKRSFKVAQNLNLREEMDGFK